MVCLLRLSVMSSQERHAAIAAEQKKEKKEFVPLVNYQPISDSAIPPHEILKG